MSTCPNKGQQNKSVDGTKGSVTKNSVHFFKILFSGLQLAAVIFRIFYHLSTRHCQLNPCFEKNFVPVPCQLVLIEQKSM